MSNSNKTIGGQPHDEFLERFGMQQALWVDSIVRDNYPAWVIKIGELSMRRPFTWLQWFLARWSGLVVERDPHLGPKKGHRKQLLSERIRIISHGKVIAERNFVLNAGKK